MEIPGRDLLLTERALTGERPWLLLGDMGLPLLVGESEDSDELEVDLWEEEVAPLPLPPPVLVTASAVSAPPPPPRLAGWGTKITDMQLSSESNEVSLWMLESLLLESEPASLRDSRRSRAEDTSLSGHSRQQRRIGDKRPGFSSSGEDCCCCCC